MSTNKKTRWLPTKQAETIKEDEVHVWRVAFPRILNKVSELIKFLDADERDRASRFHFPKDSNSFIISHAATRIILCGYAHIAPAELRFFVNDYGKPALENSSLHFNLSHSGDFALIAVTPIAPVGVDIEKVAASRAKPDLATRFFSSNEIDQLNTLDKDQFAQGFFNAWTRKEAYIKARGAGLSIPLDSFSVSLKPGEEAQLLEDANESSASREWTLQELYIDENHVGALAIKAMCFELQLFDWLSLN